jgi:hypothetical protein
MISRAEDEAALRGDNQDEREHYPVRQYAFSSRLSRYTARSKEWDDQH